MRLFFPPFRGLSFLMWGFFLFCFLINAESPIWNGQLPDPDDFLYLTQTLDLLNGQNWFDHIQHRMNPPEGTFIHYSNLLCALYALPIYLLKFLMDQHAAALVTAACFPPLFFLLFLISVRWASIPLLGPNYAGVTAYVALFATYALSLFSPGHVDHHGLEIVIAIVAGGCALRMETETPSWRWPCFSGFMTAFGLVIALEFLPFLLVLSSWIGLRALIKGKQSAHQGLIFGLTLVLSSAFFLFLSRGPASFFELDPLAYSFIYVALTAGIAICLSGVACADRLNWMPLRYILGCSLPFMTGGLFLFLFPELKAGPYGGVDPELSKMMFDNISEALPIVQRTSSLSWDVLCLIWPVMAIVANGAALVLERQSSRRWQWGLVGSLIIACTGLAAFYQHRAITYGQAFAIPALAYGLIASWSALEKAFTGGALYSARLILLLAVGPLPSVILPALVTNSAFTTSVLLFPNMVSEPACNMQVLAQMLSMPVYYGAHPKVIMNDINEGSELLFRTPHKILSAPYHENVSGNLDAVKFFSTTDVAEAETIARRRGADLVVLCHDIANIYIPQSSGNIEMTEQGSVVPSAHASFAQQLVAGHIPPWLKPIHFPLFGSMFLFETHFEDSKAQ